MVAISIRLPIFLGMDKQIEYKTNTYSLLSVDGLRAGVGVYKLSSSNRIDGVAATSIAPVKWLTSYPYSSTRTIRKAFKSMKAAKAFALSLNN